MKKDIIPELVIASLVLLFIYAGSSKLLDMRGFVISMNRQPFAEWVNKALAYSLPYLEIIIAAGLVFDKTRITALYGYVLLMICFTVYTGMVVFGFFEHTPCGCGGIISKLSWTGHFIVNSIFLLLSCLAIWLHRRDKIFMHKQGVSPKPARE